MTIRGGLDIYTIPPKIFKSKGQIVLYAETMNAKYIPPVYVAIAKFYEYDDYNKKDNKKGFFIFYFFYFITPPPTPHDYINYYIAISSTVINLISSICSEYSSSKTSAILYTFFSSLR